MMKKFVPGVLLFHSIHGLCRIKEIIQQKQMDKAALYYALIPQMGTRTSERFLIPVEHVETSGFHSPASLQQANAALDFLKGYGKLLTQTIPLWVMAKEILVFCQETPQATDQRTRQALQRSVRGLIGELAIVLEISLQEAATKVRKNLQCSFKLNPLLLAALSNASDI